MLIIVNFSFYTFTHNVAHYQVCTSWRSTCGGLRDRDGGVLVTNVVEGGQTRLRLCNGGENFALRFFVYFHRLVALATDKIDTEPLEVNTVLVNLEERYGGRRLVRGRRGGDFWIRVCSLEDTGSGRRRIILVVLPIWRRILAGHSEATIIPSLSFVTSVLLLIRGS